MYVEITIKTRLSFVLGLCTDPNNFVNCSPLEFTDLAMAWKCWPKTLLKLGGQRIVTPRDIGRLSSPRSATGVAARKYFSHISKIIQKHVENIWKVCSQLF